MITLASTCGQLWLPSID